MSQTPEDSVVPAIQRGDLVTAQRILVPLAAAGNAWAYYNLGVVHSEYAVRATGTARTSRYVESYAHFRAAELLGDSLASHDREEARAMFPTARLRGADARVTALLARHGQAQLARRVDIPIAPARIPTNASSAPVARDEAGLDPRYIEVKRSAIVTPGIDWEDRVRYVRELSVRPNGRAALVEVLTVDVLAAVLAGSPRPATSLFQRVVEGPGLSYDTAIRLGDLLFDVLSRTAPPFDGATQKVNDALANVEREKPHSALVGSLTSLAVEWSKPRAPASAPNRNTKTCMEDRPSTSCVLQWIATLTAPEASLSLSCMRTVASTSAMGMMYDLGGRSDEHDIQLAMQFCKDGNAFVLSQQYHEQLRRGAPGQFARLRDAYKVASRVKLILF